MAQVIDVDRDKIDILRAIAIIAVILIHTTSNVFHFYQPLSIPWYLILSFDQLIRFSVPLFVALSGFTLAYKYKDENSVPLKDFYMRRLYKILPLYIIWSTILYFFIKYFDPIVGESEKFSLWQALILGKADYHLYFVPMLFQLYLLFPFLFDLIRRFNLKILIPIFILQIAAFLVIGKHVENLKPDLTWGDQYTYIYFWNWIFYFVLGIYLTRITNPKSIYKYLLILASIFTLDWLIENSFSMVRTGVDIIAITRFTQVPTLFFATCVILFLILWGKRLNSLPDRLKRILVQMGRDSFVVYLLHTIIIRLLFSVWKIPISNNFFLYSISVIVLSFLFARLFNLLLNKLPIKLT